MIDENANPLGRLISLVTNERVRNELDLAGPQMANLKENLDELKEDFKSRVQEMQKKNEAEKRKLRPELMKHIAGQLDELLAKVMRSDQFERYKQIRLQQDGLAAFTDAAVRDEIGFSDEEKQKLLPVLTPGMKKVRAASRNGTDAHGKTPKEVEQAELAKITALMSETQLAKWQEMLGSEFDFGDEPAPAAQSKGPGGPGRQGPGGSGPGAP